MIDKTMPDHHGVNITADKREYPNETIELLLERASCRNFMDKNIEPEIMNYILDAGTKAASGGNLQPFSIIQIESEESKKKIVSWGNQKLIENAPVNLLFCIDFHRNKQWAEIEAAPYSSGKTYDTFWIAFQDTIIAAQSICTAADSFGLGSVYLGTVMRNLRELKELLNLPDGVIPIVMIAMGYPKSSKAIRKKLPVDVIVHKEKYQYKENDELKKIFDEKYPNVKIEITPERLQIMESVCKTVHGEDFANKCLAKINKQGFISVVQRYFGLHYIANGNYQENEDFLGTLKDLGLDFFQNHEPVIPYKKLTEEELKPFTGKFHYDVDPENEFVEIIIRNNQLALKEGENRVTNLFYTSENKFFAMVADMEIKFTDDKKSYEHTFFGKKYIANRVN